MRTAYFLFLLCFFACSTAVGGDKANANADSSTDALAPKTDPATALTSPLKVVTVSTNSLAESMLFYRDAMGMTVEGPLKVSRRQKSKLRKQWGIDAAYDWQTYRFYRPGAKQAAQIQLLVFEQLVPAIHKTWSALELGTFSMGFPNMGQISQDDKVRKLGFGALNEIEIYTVPRTDKTLYEIQETIFNGPDFVHAVGIHRGNGMPQLGDLDANGLGGPAYSAAIVKDSQQMIDFMSKVLGWELRSDRQWKSAGREGALNVPDGTEFRFSIMYSQGATTGHILLVDYLNVDDIDNGVAPRLPHRGIGMWSIATRDMEEVMQRANDFGVEIVQAPQRLKTPMYGDVIVATMLAPNGLLIEVVEQAVAP